MKSLTTKSVYHDKYMLLCFFVTFFQPLMLWNREPFNYIFRIIQFVVWVIVLCHRFPGGESGIGIYGYGHSFASLRLQLF